MRLPWTNAQCEKTQGLLTELKARSIRKCGQRQGHSRQMSCGGHVET